MRKFRKLKIDLLQRLLNGRNQEEIKRQQLTTMMTISLILLVHETSRSRPADDDEMDVDERPTTRKKRVVQEISDDDLMEMPTAKKPRKAPTKPTVSRSRQSSESSNPPPAVRKTPTRAATSRAKKVVPNSLHG